jgi:hypothetical protein
MVSVRLLVLPKMTSRTGEGGTARHVGTGTHFGLGPIKNEGNPTVVAFVIWGMTWLMAEKLSG